MKKKQLAVWMCVGVMMMAAGCSKTAVAESDTAETISDETKEDDVQEEISESESTEDQNTDSEEESTAKKDNDTQQDTQEASDELQADVISVDYNNKSVVASEIFTETYDDGSSAAVSLVGDRGDDAESITVYFKDDAGYTLKIIKNGGADVTTKEAEFSDIQEGDILDLKGKRAFSEKSGDEFLATGVTISRVILE